MTADVQNNYVGTLVGESSSQEFRLAVRAEAIREQDIIAVDADLKSPESGQVEQIRVWAKVQRIERVNPLFPTEAGHELAETQTNPLDTVLSFSREMVTAVCQVLGYEKREATSKGKLDHLRYPAKPATSAYKPETVDLKRIVLGDLQEERGLDIAHLSNRDDVDVHVDGHTVVMRHLAILAMTGAGKSWAARRIIEELSGKKYPVIIFDPHGDYTGLAELESLQGRVNLYYAHLPIINEDIGDIIQIIEGLSGETISPTQRDTYDSFMPFAMSALSSPQMINLAQSLFKITQNSKVTDYPLHPDLLGLSHFADALERLCNESDEGVREGHLQSIGFDNNYALPGNRAGTYRAIARQLRRSGFAVRRMEKINKARVTGAKSMPTDRKSLIEYGNISVISLAGYTEEIQATIYTLIADSLFSGRVQGHIDYPFVMLLEEAHKFVPSRTEHPAIIKSISLTKQIAQEGRKFGVGLILISQRPSRLDETALSQCNSQIIMRMVNPADQNFVRRVIESLGDDEIRMLPSLDVGEAILAGQMINFPVLSRIKPPSSKGEREEEDAFKELEKAHTKRTQST